MCKAGLMVLVALALNACGGSPDDDQAAAQQPPPASQSTELRDAAQAPLQRAEAVQQTLDERAAKLNAETRAALDQDADPNEDPNAAKDKKDDHEDEE